MLPSVATLVLVAWDTRSGPARGELRAEGSAVDVEERGEESVLFACLFVGKLSLFSFKMQALVVTAGGVQESWKLQGSNAIVPVRIFPAFLLWIWLL